MTLQLSAPGCGAEDGRDGGQRGDWRVFVVSKDEVGKELMLNKFKPFRLTALRVDPAGDPAFSSNHAREEAFEDEVWVSRLMGPSNNLIVAADSKTQDVLCAAFLRDITPDSDGSHPEMPLVFGIYGLWTLPSARRKGMALEVLNATKTLAEAIANTRGKEYSLQVEAYEENKAAVKLYSKVGFTPVGSDGESVKLSLAMP